MRLRDRIVALGDRASGYGTGMADPRLEDHAVGVELQLTELNEARERARVQGRDERVTALDREILVLQDELARTAEALTAEHWPAAEIHAPHPG